MQSEHCLQEVWEPKIIRVNQSDQVAPSFGNSSISGATLAGIGLLYQTEARVVEASNDITTPVG
jgi:hypothetical protein